MIEEPEKYSNEPSDPDQSKSLAAAHQGPTGLANLPADGDLDLSPNQVLLVAIQHGLSGEALNALLQARKELRQEKQLEAFNKAFNKFQSQIPVIKKTKPVMNKDGNTVRFYFAPIDSIVEQIKPYLKKNGLSVDIDTEIIERPESNYKLWVKAIAYVNHVDGHVKEPRVFEQPIVQSDIMTYQHSVNTAKSIALRIAYTNALGLVTADPDTDTEASASNVHDAMKTMAEFGVSKEQMMKHIGARHFGDVSDEQLKKWHEAINQLREGYTATEVFGGGSAADALDSESDGGPTPRELFQRLKNARDFDEIADIQADMADALKTKGHKEVGEIRLKHAQQRLQQEAKKRGKPNQPKNQTGAKPGNVRR